MDTSISTAPAGSTIRIRSLAAVRAPPPAPSSKRKLVGWTPVTARRANYSEPSSDKRHESVFESFHRPRLTQSIDLGPVEVSIHSTYAMRAYTDDSSEHENADDLLMAERAPAQRCLLTVALLVWSRWRPCNRQVPTAQYGHDPEPEA